MRRGALASEGGSFSGNGAGSSGDDLNNEEGAEMPGRQAKKAQGQVLRATLKKAAGGRKRRALTETVTTGSGRAVKLNEARGFSEEARALGLKEQVAVNERDAWALTI